MVSVQSPSAIIVFKNSEQFIRVSGRSHSRSKKAAKKSQFARVLTSSEYLKGFERKKEKREKEEETKNRRG